MITVIDIESRRNTPIPEGTVRHILTPSNDRTRVEVARYEVDSGKTHRIQPAERTQVVYVMEGKDAEVNLIAAGKAATCTAQRGCGVYLEPKEEADIKASGTPLVLLSITVPKHTDIAIDP